MFLYLTESFITLTLIYFSMYTLIEKKYSFVKSSIIMSLFICFTMVFEFILLKTNRATPTSVYDYSLISTALPNLICLLLLSKKKKDTTIFIFLFLSLAGSVISVFISLIAFISPFPFAPCKFTLHIMFAIMLLYICRHILRKPFEILHGHSFSQLKYLFLFPIVYELMAISYNVNPTRDVDVANKVNLPYLSNVYAKEMPFFILFIITTFVLYFFTVIIIIKSHSMFWLKEEDTDLKYHIGAIDIIEHDKKHYLRIVSSLLEDGRLDEAKAMLNEYSQKKVNHDINYYCENPTLNSVLNIYNNKCDLNRIIFDCKIKDDFTDAMESENVTILSIALSNALENALEASIKYQITGTFVTDMTITPAPYISLSAFKKNSQTIIKISNLFSGNLTIDKAGMPVSSKAVTNDIKHGIGLSSIYHYCEKLGGIASYHADGNVFNLNIILPTGNCQPLNMQKSC